MMVPLGHMERDQAKRAGKKQLGSCCSHPSSGLSWYDKTRMAHLCGLLAHPTRLRWGLWAGNRPR